MNNNDNYESKNAGDNSDSGARSDADKQSLYAALTLSVESFVDGEGYWVGKLANATAAIHEALGSLWTGFYIVKDDSLWLGPFQGPVACSRIGRGRGVCGTAWERGTAVVVTDVEQFPGHIACSSLSRSEIVVPVFAGGKSEGSITAVLDIDSTAVGTFDDTDRQWLELICAVIGRHTNITPETLL